jgi:hypothetical protein
MDSLKFIKLFMNKNSIHSDREKSQEIIKNLEFPKNIKIFKKS